MGAVQKQQLSSLKQLYAIGVSWSFHVSQAVNTIIQQPRSISGLRINILIIIYQRHKLLEAIRKVPFLIIF